MQVVTIIANQRGTDEWGVMNGMTYRQIEHVAGALVADKMFVARVLLHGIRKGSKEDKQDDGKTGSQDFTFDRGSLPGWYKPLKPRPGVPKISAGVVDLRNGGEAPDIFAMQTRAVKDTVSEDRHSPKMKEPHSRQRVTRRDDENR